MIGRTSLFAVVAWSAWLLLSACAWAGGQRFEELRYVNSRSWLGDTHQLSIAASGSVAIDGVEPRRLTLNAGERAKLARLVAAVDWAHVQPRYAASVDDGDEAQLTISVGQRMYATAVVVVGAAGEPPALTKLLLYIEQLRRDLSPANRSGIPAQPGQTEPAQAVGALR